MELRYGSRLVVTNGQFTRLLSSSLPPLDIVLSAELAKLPCRLDLTPLRLLRPEASESGGTSLDFGFQAANPSAKDIV